MYFSLMHQPFVFVCGSKALFFILSLPLPLQCQQYSPNEIYKLMSHTSVCV